METAIRSARLFPSLLLLTLLAWLAPEVSAITIAVDPGGIVCEGNPGDTFTITVTVSPVCENAAEPIVTCEGLAITDTTYSAGTWTGKIPRDYAGSYLITAINGCNENDVETNVVTVVRVASINVYSGTRVSTSGSGSGTTETWVACLAACGTATVTATPDPALSESELPGCWTTTATGEVAGEEKLTRAVNVGSAQIAYVTFSAGASWLTAEVKVVEVSTITVSPGVKVAEEGATETWVACKTASGNVTVTATANPGLEEAEANTEGICWKTTGGNGTAILTRTADQSTAGTTPITFEAGVSSKTVVVKVVEVGAITVTPGTKVSDVGGTETWVACKAASGNVTVTATANPGLEEAEAKTPGICWKTTGGNGDDKLTRTVPQTSAGTTPITFEAGVSSKTVVVKVIEVGTITVTPGTKVSGEGEPETWVAALKTSGDISVAATTNPVITEDEARTAGICWTYTGGNGEGRLTRTVTATQKGGTSITFTAGNSSKTVIVYVVELTNRTVATSPPDRGRTELGVGEEVVLYFDPPVVPATAEWSRSGDGSLSAESGASVTYTASRFHGDSCSIDASLGSVTWCCIFSVIAPTQLLLEFKELDADGACPSDDPSSPVFSTNCKLTVYIGPDSVSFDKVKLWEGYCFPAKTGYYADHGAAAHYDNCQGGIDPSGWVSGKGSRKMSLDLIGAHVYDSVFYDGSAVYSLGWSYSVGDSGTPLLFATATQKNILELDEETSVTTLLNLKGNGSDVGSKKDDCDCIQSQY